MIGELFCARFQKGHSCWKRRPVLKKHLQNHNIDMYIRKDLFYQHGKEPDNLQLPNLDSHQSPA